MASVRYTFFRRDSGGSPTVSRSIERMTERYRQESGAFANAGQVPQASACGSSPRDPVLDEVKVNKWPTKISSAGSSAWSAWLLGRRVQRQGLGRVVTSSSPQCPADEHKSLAFQPVRRERFPALLS